MGRKAIIFDRITARFTKGTLARINAVLEPKETQAGLIRQAVSRELRRRERQKEKG